ncbi:di-heme oxidoreductase family protein [Pseudotamlana agarivorans]|uniref:di-heme oxidoreductase family protein n=1 Tax=Pseudotamlana agarivorans TaxID=481183 RepID=UPI00082D0AEC|nr:di-heme oxidoredictase family protein [Tamlana agarivorans]
MKYVFCCILFISILSCDSDTFTEQDYIDINYEIGEENLVSHLSIEAFTADKAFGRGIPELTNLESSFFGIGNAMFDQSWVSAPATTTSRDGLGPLFNARACSGCHLRDGRGKPLLESGANSEGFLIRLSHGNNEMTGPIALFNYGGQLQDNSNLGIKNEGQIQVAFELISGEYPDGTAFELRNPTYTIANENYGSLGAAEQSPRVGQQVIGLGFIDALSEASILVNEDINDADGDGISGKANWVWNVKANKNTIGKFGWKANQPTLEQQVAGALNGDMGLTTSIFPDENCPDGVDCSTLYNGVNEGDSVEIPDTQFSRLMLYQAAISVPIRRDFKNVDVLKGKKLFNDLACVSCHVNDFTTSSYDLLPQISGVKIRPYSDFLLHDMGDALADNRGDFLANGNEWRTQPLWGLGLIEMVNGHTFLLHDGRARNIEEAILWHGGEAEKSKTDFMNLSKVEREHLLSFLNSL